MSTPQDTKWDIVHSCIMSPTSNIKWGKQQPHCLPDLMQLHRCSICGNIEWKTVERVEEDQI